MEEPEERERFVEELLSKINEPTPINDIAKRTGVSYSKITKMAEKIGLKVSKKHVMIPRYVIVVEKAGDDENAR